MVVNKSFCVVCIYLYIGDEWDVKFYVKVLLNVFLYIYIIYIKAINVYIDIDSFGKI